MICCWFVSLFFFPPKGMASCWRRLSLPRFATFLAQLCMVDMIVFALLRRLICLRKVCLVFLLSFFFKFCLKDCQMPISSFVLLLAIPCPNLKSAKLWLQPRKSFPHSNSKVFHAQIVQKRGQFNCSSCRLSLFSPVSCELI